MNYMEQFRRSISLVDDINAILKKFGIQETISLGDLIITDRTISDLVKPDAKLSEAIANFLWPSISSCTVYHFTSKSAAESILDTGIFRLTNIAGRYNEGEIETFCKTHELTSYLALDGNGHPVYRNLIMPNTFYASFTDIALTDKQEQWFWDNFASCDGVRLKIEVTASNPNFRRLRYEEVEGKPIELLSKLVKCIREKYKREFILKGISRLCSFYLSGRDYGIENEYRMLYRAWDGFGPQPKGAGANSYIELPLAVMTEAGYMLNVIEVHARVKPKMPTCYVFSKRNS